MLRPKFTSLIEMLAHKLLSKAPLTRYSQRSSRVLLICVLCIIYRVLHGPCLTHGLHTTTVPHQVDQSFQFVVCGAGAGGLAVASILGRRFGPGKLAILDPAEVSKITTSLAHRNLLLNIDTETLLSANVYTGRCGCEDTGTELSAHVQPYTPSGQLVTDCCNWL